MMFRDCDIEKGMTLPIRGVDYVAMGERIKARRQEMGLTQGELAKLVHVSGSFVGHLERAEKIASVETLARICGCMNISMDYLVMGVKRECDRENCALYLELRKVLHQYTAGSM